MNLILQPEAPPLRIDPHGAIRVGQTQVLLEIVVQAYQDGASPDDIISRYPALDAADVYGALGYYLRHKTAIEGYLRERDRTAERVWREIDARQGEQAALYARLHSARPK